MSILRTYVTRYNIDRAQFAGLSKFERHLALYKAVQEAERSKRSEIEKRPKSIRQMQQYRLLCGVRVYNPETTAADLRRLKDQRRFIMKSPQSTKRRFQREDWHFRWMLAVHGSARYLKRLRCTRAKPCACGGKRGCEKCSRQKKDAARRQAYEERLLELGGAVVMYTQEQLSEIQRSEAEMPELFLMGLPNY